MALIKKTSFADWLKREIEERLMTREKFALACGVTRDAVNLWINRGGSPRGTSISRIARGLNVPRDIVEKQMDRPRRNSRRRPPSRAARASAA